MAGLSKSGIILSHPLRLATHDSLIRERPLDHPVQRLIKLGSAQQHAAAILGFEVVVACRYIGQGEGGIRLDGLARAELVAAPGAAAAAARMTNTEQMAEELLLMILSEAVPAAGAGVAVARFFVTTQLKPLPLRSAP